MEIATALQLIKDGYIVYGAARRVEKMNDIISAGGHAIALDVTDYEQVKSEINSIIQKEGRVDILVNNAGYAVYGPVEEITVEQAKRQFDVNLFGLAEVTKAIIPHNYEKSEIWNHFEYIFGRWKNIYSVRSMVSLKVGVIH